MKLVDFEKNNNKKKHMYNLQLKDLGQSCADPEGRGRTGSPDPLNNHKNIGFLSNSGLDTLKNHKAQC